LHGQPVVLSVDGERVGAVHVEVLIEMEATNGSTKGEFIPPEGFTVPEKRLLPSFFLQRNQSPSSAVVPWWFPNPHQSQACLFRSFRAWSFVFV
jgi:hypothetical protein